MRKRENESAIEFLRRVVEWLDLENESLLSQLPTVEAVLDYAELWSVYKTDLIDGIVEAIEEGDDPSPFQEFVRKHKLDWKIPCRVVEA